MSAEGARAWEPEDEPEQPDLMGFSQLDHLNERLEHFQRADLNREGPPPTTIDDFIERAMAERRANSNVDFSFIPGGVADNLGFSLPPQTLPEEAALNRALADYHRDQYYALRDSDPEAADWHHGQRYDFMGKAALQERSVRLIGETEDRDIFMFTQVLRRILGAVTHRPYPGADPTSPN